VRLLDISRGGAAVECDRDISLDAPLLFGLAGSPQEDELLDATIARIVTTPTGKYRVHLVFAGACPDALLKRALFGARDASRPPFLRVLATFFGRSPKTDDARQCDRR
jgi:hypothetical protein